MTSRTATRASAATWILGGAMFAFVAGLYVSMGDFAAATLNGCVVVMCGLNADKAIRGVEQWSVALRRVRIALAVVAVSMGVVALALLIR